MKEKFLKNSIEKIKKKYPEYDEDKLEVISYGLEALYITITKTIVIFGIAFLLGVFKEVILILLFYNVIRTTAFGMHAKKSSHCYIISGVLFIGAAVLCKYVYINGYIKIIVSLVSFITIIKYAPADTYKRPLLNEKKRKIYKVISIVNSLIYVILICLFKDSLIASYITAGLFDASLMIHPLTYRVFHMPYNNYKSYETSYS